MKKITAILLAALLGISVFAACGEAPTSSTVEPPVPATPTAEPTAEPAAEPSDVPVEIEPAVYSVASLKGPTTMGMVQMMKSGENSETFNTYSVEMFGTADEITTGIVSGSIDIANVPCNLASVLYNKTGGAVSVVGINTLGVLYVVETGDTIQSVADLKGKTIYSTGKGTTPEFSLNYILTQNGLDPETDVTIEYKSEATEVAAALETAEDAIAVLPQPYVTAAMAQNENLRIALSLSDAWDAVQDENGGALVTGVTIARNEVIEKNPQAFEKFLEEYAASVAYTASNPDETAELIAEYGIVAKAPLAKKALPYCNITLITGEEMQNKISGYLNVLFEANPQSVGGKLPDEAFYYTAE